MVTIASSSFHPVVAGGFPDAPPRAPGTAAAGSAAFTCDTPGPALPAPADAAPRAPPASEALVPRRAPVRLHLCGSGCPARSFAPRSRTVRVLLPGSPRRSRRRPCASYGRPVGPAPRPRHRFQNGAGLAGARFPPGRARARAAVGRSHAPPEQPGPPASRFPRASRCLSPPALGEFSL